MKKHSQIRILYSNYKDTGRPTGTAIKGNLSVHLAEYDNAENRTNFQFENYHRETGQRVDTLINITFADGSIWTGNTEELQASLQVSMELLKKSQEFITGFEDDEDQEGTPELLAEIRALRAKLKI